MKRKSCHGALRKLPRPWRPAALRNVQHSIHEALCLMIIVEELPLDFAEKRGFKGVMTCLNPQFASPPVTTMEQDCLKIYREEKKLIQSYFEKSKPRMSLGMNTWVSEEGLTYLCLSGHFVDEKWEMNRLVLNVILCPVDEVEEASDCVEECLAGWGINQVFALTINYKPSTCAFVDYLGGRFVSRNAVLLGGKYLHLRCLTTVINRFAVDELKKLADSVDRVRRLVRYFWISTDNQEKLKELAAAENVECHRFPFLDTPDRWNSVRIMLETAARFESVYEKYAISDVEFRRAFMQGGSRGRVKLPSKSDWAIVKALSKVLKVLYELRCRVSGSKYYSSNATAYFSVLKDLNGFVTEWAASDDNALAAIASRTKSRSGQYFGGPHKTNVMVYVVMVFDPRYKLEQVLSTIKGIYEGKAGEDVCDLAKKALFDLFEEYKKLSAEKDEAELDMYLSENVEIDTDNFDLLKWWKLNGPRFPTLARMARDLLAMPVSTVALESDFSAGGVLSAKNYRYSLDPEVMEAVVCASDWLRTTPKKPNDEEYEQDSRMIDARVCTSN